MNRAAKSAKHAHRHRLEMALIAALVLVTGEICAASDDAMIRLSGGVFTMGSDHGLPDERPAHTMAVAPFSIDRRPVTNAEFAAFLQRVGDTRNARGENLFDADDGDARLHKIDGTWRAD